jgi:hypothetical protein
MSGEPLTVAMVDEAADMLRTAEEVHRLAECVARGEMPDGAVSSPACALLAQQVTALMSRVADLETVLMLREHIANRVVRLVSEGEVACG